jgi:CO/xanthine dehydrogenase FAD-binding subunit
VIREGKNVNYCFPATVEEAVRLKHQYRERAHYIAGGTDLLLILEQEQTRPELLIDLTRIPPLHRLEVRGNRILIGSAVPYNRLLSFEPIQTGVPFLAKAIRTIGGVQIRNIATLAGNLVNASPAGDTLPPLYILNAQVSIQGIDSSRILPISEFILGVRKTALLPSEIVTHVSFDILDSNWYGTFEKIGLRKAMAIAVVSVALLLKVEHKKVSHARISLGAVAPTVTRVPEAENCLLKSELEEEVVEKVALLASEACTPIDDIRASAHYRREAVRGLVRRGLMSLRTEINSQE